MTDPMLEAKLAPTLHCETHGSRLRIEVRDGERIMHIDEIDPASAFARRRAAERVVESEPTFDRAAVESALAERAAAPAHKRTLVARDFRELLDLPTPGTLVRGILGEQAVVVLGGLSRSFKSFLLIDWLLSLYFGLPWQGRRTLACSGIYFGAEGMAYIGQRARAWMLRHHDDIAGLDVGARALEVVNEVPRLAVPAGIAEIRAVLRDFHARHGHYPGIIAFDTLAQGLDDADENSSSALNPVFRALASIRNDFSLTAIVAHHLRKDAGGEIDLSALRGSGAIGNNVDQVFIAKRDEAQQVLAVAKNKDGNEDKEIARSEFSLVTVGTDDEGMPISSGVLVPVSRNAAAAEEQAINSLLLHYRQVFGDAEFATTTAEQMKPSHVPRAAVRELLVKAREAGRLRYRIDGRSVLFRLLPGGAA